MEPLSLKEIINSVGGKLISGHPEQTITNISIDSRTMRTNDLFIAIKGRRFDGHSFVNEAIQKGACSVICANDFNTGSIKDTIGTIKVKDTIEALQNIAKTYRQKFHIPVVAITGSNGKTTVKDIIHSIASLHLNILKTEGTKNNHIGVPLTIMKLDRNTDAAVIEMGMSGFGEIRNLSRIARPTMGLITNINPAHIEFFDSVEEIAEAKSELLDELPAGATAILNSDDEWFNWLQQRTNSATVTFGIKNDADFKASDIRQDRNGIRFRLQMKNQDESSEAFIPIIGTYNIYNTLAALAVCNELRIDIKKAVGVLSEIKLPSMRFEILETNGLTIINDAYNANPASMAAALETFSKMDLAGKRIFVCGDMLELGWYALKAHRSIGKLVNSSSIDYLITFGESAEEVRKSAISDGLNENYAKSFGTIDEIVEFLAATANKGDGILIKGSRAKGMERIVDGLRKKLIHT